VVLAAPGIAIDLERLGLVPECVDGVLSRQVIDGTCGLPGLPVENLIDLGATI